MKKSKKKDKKRKKRTNKQIAKEIPKENIGESLTFKQELFCKIFATSREFFGNGVQAYIEAYKPSQKGKSWYRSAQVCASRLLSNVIICQKIDSLLELGGLNDVSIDKHLLYVVTQYEDLNAKMKAIVEYNKLKQRVTNKVDLTSNGKELESITGMKITIEPKNGDSIQNKKPQAVGSS